MDEAANATSSDGAANATSSDGAANATSSDGAANATSADEAANATSSDEAANATSSDEAANATSAVEAANATSFDGAADSYRRARPGYPGEAIGWLVPPSARRVLDLGAGTGKLARGLVDAGHDVIAVEPLPGMRAELAAAVPEAEVRAGDAAAIPLPAGAVDAATVAQAWHWFDPDTAAPEIARVLRPGGTLGVVWNVRDTTVDWVARLGETLGSTEASHAAEPRLGRWFGPTEYAEFTLGHRLDEAALLDLVRSRSYVILLSAPERDRLLRAVGELTRTHPQLAGRTTFVLPYVTRCWRATRAG